MAQLKGSPVNLPELLMLTLSTPPFGLLSNGQSVLALSVEAICHDLEQHKIVKKFAGNRYAVERIEHAKQYRDLLESHGSISRHIQESIRTINEVLSERHDSDRRRHLVLIVDTWNNRTYPRALEIVFGLLALLLTFRLVSPATGYGDLWLGTAQHSSLNWIAYSEFAPSFIVSASAIVVLNKVLSMSLSYLDEVQPSQEKLSCRMSFWTFPMFIVSGCIYSPVWILFYGLGFIILSLNMNRIGRAYQVEAWVFERYRSFSSNLMVIGSLIVPVGVFYLAESYLIDAGMVAHVTQGALTVINWIVATILTFVFLVVWNRHFKSPGIREWTGTRWVGELARHVSKGQPWSKN